MLVLTTNVFIPNAKYSNAMEYIENGQYDKAEDILYELNDFKDSKKQIKLISIREFLDSKNYSQAIENFKNMNGKIEFIYDYHGGNKSNKTTSLCGENVYSCEKQGYRFNKYVIKSYEIDTSNMTLYIQAEAIYDVITYNIKYHLDGGNNFSNNPAQYTVESNDIVLKAATKDGYEFVGWSTSLTSNPKLDICINTSSGGDLEFYANFKPIQYEINYELNNGVNNSKNVKSFNIESKNITIYPPSREGYIFLGWSVNGSSTLYKTYTITTGSKGTHELVANWYASDYEITYVLNGGNNNTENPVGYSIDSNTIVLKSPTKTGYTFIGWTSKNNSTPIKNLEIKSGSMGDLTFTANWHANSYVIKLIANGGSVSKDTINVTYDNEYSLPNPTRIAYEFDGWYDGLTLISNSGDWTIASNKTYTAKWKPISYNISYNLNGGTNDLSNPSTYNIESNLIIKSPIKSGYTFNGWIYNNGTPIINYEIEEGLYGNIVLTADFTPNTYMIEYDVNGGDNLINNKQKVIYDLQYTLKIPTRTGYTFVCWKKNGSTFNEGTWSLTNNIKLVAEWKANEYDITIIDETTNVFSVNYDSRYSINNPLKENYIFKGYYSESFGKGIQYTNENGDSLSVYSNTFDVTLYPYYQYSIEFVSNGGSEVDNLILDENVPLSSNIVSSKKNRTFDGWYTNNLLTNEYDGKIGNVILYAKWLEEALPTDLYYSINDTVLINGWKRDLGNLVIPSHISGLEVTDISNSYGSNSISSVFIPNTVININNSAFKDCGLSNGVIFEENSNLETIGNFAFSGTNIYNLVIPNSVIDIGYGVLYDCSKLKELSIPFVGQPEKFNCFGYIFDSTKNNSYANGKIPSTLKKVSITRDGNIPSDAFKNSYNLNEIAVLTNNCTLNSNWFNNCYASKVTLPKIIEFNDSSASCSPYYLYYNGTVEDWCKLSFSKFTSNPFGECNSIYFYEDNGWTEIKDLVIPSSIKIIGDYQFYNFDSIESVTFNENITEMGKYSFYDCDLLKTVEFEKNIQLGMIASSSFESCDSLENIILPESISNIGGRAFMDCTSLKKLNIPNNVSSIGYCAFNGCTGLDELIFEENSVLKVIDSFAFNSCTSITELTIPSSLEAMKFNCFSNCSALMKVTFEENSSLLNIESSVFANCSDLEFFNMPDNVSTIGKGILSGCENMKSISLPFIGSSREENLILGYVFMPINYSNTTNGFIPYSLIDVKVTQATTFAANAFNGCYNIENLYISNTIKEFSTSAFAGCTGLQNVYFKGSLEDWCNLPLLDDYSNPMSFATKFYYLDGNEYVLLEDLIIPSEIISINENQFYSFECIKSVVVSKNVETINKNAFKNCINIVSITFEEESKTNHIVTNAFLYCSSLKELHLPVSVTILEDNILQGCYSIEKLTIPYLTNAMFGRIFMHSKRAGSVVGGLRQYYDVSNENVPSSLKEVVILIGDTIYEEVFKGCEYIEKITLPDSITNINSGAFAEMYNLKEVNIPYGVLEIEGSVFQSCQSLKKISIPANVTAIKTNAFNGCYSLESIFIPKSVETIEQYAFAHCTSLSEIVFEEGIEISTIPLACFYSCEKLSSISIPSSVILIDDYAFTQCSNLVTVLLTLDSKLATIDEGAFSYCSSLVSFYCPDTLRTIWDYSFRSTTSLKEFSVSKNTSISSYAFPNSGLKNITFRGKIDECALNKTWKDFVLDSVVCSDGVITISQ